MDKLTRSKSLLIELLLAVLFLALSATVILRLFLLAYTAERSAARTNRGTAVAQNWAEKLYAADDAEALLSENGFLSTGNRFLKETEDGLFVEILIKNAETDRGLLRSTEIAVAFDSETLIEIEGRRYMPGEAD